ncbi:MAG: acetate--CoA ligase, partial [Sulfitobacter sp.]|nr:acetate--CoA ligase [Sulfitobacter sp.]
MSKDFAKKAVIRKTAEAREAANMQDYQQIFDSFSWREAETLLDGLPDGHLNIAHEAIDRHVKDGHGDQIAMRWIAKSGDRTDFTYGELSRLTAET